VVNYQNKLIFSERKNEEIPNYDHYDDQTKKVPR